MAARESAAAEANISTNVNANNSNENGNNNNRAKRRKPSRFDAALNSLFGPTKSDSTENNSGSNKDVDMSNQAQITE